MSDEFDVVLDRCLADLASGRETVEACLRRYPADASRLSSLLPLAETVRAAPAPTPLPLDKRRALESRLLRQAGKMRPLAAASRAAAPRRPLWRRGGVLAAVFLIVCLLLVTSTVSVSATSLPGDILYPVKRAAEQVRVALTPDTSQAAVHLELAQARLQELNALAQRGEVSTDSLADLDAEIGVVLQRVAQLPLQEQSALLMRIDSFQSEQARTLTFVASLARGDKQSKAQAALSDFVARREVLKVLMLRVSSPVNSGGPNEGKGLQPTKAQNDEHPSQGGAPQGGASRGGGATSQSTLNPSATDKPTATDRPKVDTRATKKPGPQQTPRATKPPPAKPDKPTSQSQDHAPGQGNSNPGSPPVHSTKAPKK